MKRLARIMLWFKVTFRRKIKYNVTFDFPTIRRLSTLSQLHSVLDSRDCANGNEAQMHMLYIVIWGKKTSIREVALNREHHLQ